MHAYAHSAPLPLATATRNLEFSLVLRQPKEKKEKKKGKVTKVTASLTNPIIYFLSQKKKVRSQSSDPIIMSTIVFNELKSPYILNIIYSLNNFYLVCNCNWMAGTETQDFECSV